MDKLLEKYNDYMRIIDCKAEYELDNGKTIGFRYRKENFAHLLGLHKLKDIQLIQFWQDKNNRTVNLNTVIRKIRNSSFTDAIVCSSVFFPQIKERYNNFSYDNLTTLNYTDVVIDFNPLLINSKLKSDYILFEEKSGEYNHMSIAQDAKSGNRYVESFFHEMSNKYIQGQIIRKIKKFTLYDNNNAIIVSDSFAC